ncbi:MAG: metal-dependent hydrolase [Candidatus Moraniibacteriota bacterium]|nr:MAG: metal-dependent hydrolase [Candidatus Moranbacteria bacterium]
MASFKTHITFGISLGVLGSVFMVVLALGENIDFLLALFILALLGSILPDIDSDSGIPFHLTFGSLSIISGVFVFFLLFERNSEDTLIKSIFGSVLVMLCVWGMIGGFFKKLTKHRGMVHSIPAALLFFLITFILTSKYFFENNEAFLLGLILGLGYVSHLILDEINSLVDFQGRRLIPKQSLGSSLKFFSSSKLINFLVYASIFLLFFPHKEDFKDLAMNILSKIE